MQHVITKNIGNLRGFSTDSIFLRPPNIADVALNIQTAPDRTLQARRGYQCQIGEIGGMGIGTFDDPTTDTVRTVTIGLDGFLYNKLTKQIYFYYDGRVTGIITAINNANPVKVTSNGHGLQSGAKLILRQINGKTALNNNTYTITVVDVNNFTLNGVDGSLTPNYISGGNWSIAFADQRYLNFTIFTDPRYLTTNPGWNYAIWSFDPWGAPSGESITANITVNRAAQISSNASGVNTVSVEFGHELVSTDVIQFNSTNGVFNQRNVTSVTPTTISFDGDAVSVFSGVYISQFFDIPFRKGFDVSSPYLISTFISTITNPSTGIYGLQVAINGISNFAAAFLQIFEPIIIDSAQRFMINYWYFNKINFTGAFPPFPGSANIQYQNSQDFEIASMAALDDVIYIANGLDYPQKYDGQTVYRAGMPIGIRTTQSDNNTFSSLPFQNTNSYQYSITYEQIDNFNHLVEGENSAVSNHTVAANGRAINVTVTNLMSTAGNNWNTNGAVAIAGVAGVYGPDSQGYYYDFVPVSPAFTLKIGDSAYYADTTIAVATGGAQTGVNTINVGSGHGILPGDVVYFIDSATTFEDQRSIELVTATSITIFGPPVTVNNTDFLSYRVSKVFGNVAIVDTDQINVNVISVKKDYPNITTSEPTIQINDVVEFIDSNDDLQRRNVTAIGSGTITIDGIPVTITNLTLIYSINQRSNAINLQRLNVNGITFASGYLPISNNLRINIYRTELNSPFGVTGSLFLVASIPNDSSGPGTQVYIDGLPDTELGIEFSDPDVAPNPPPISKYLKAFGNQMYYAGGQRGNAENSDRVFFSEGNFPENVPLSSHFFNVPNADDDVTGIGVAGSTLVTTKNHSLWAATGNALSGNLDVIQIAPGTNIGCVAHATIATIGGLMYFVHTNGVYSITENQLFPTDPFGNPIPISLPINVLFRETPYLPQTQFKFKRAVAINYTKDLQYLLFLPCEDVHSSIRTANSYSQLLAYDYQDKNWYTWSNINAAGGLVVIDDDLYFQERRYSGVDGNTANLYKQHRFYRLIDHADHAGAQYIAWKSSWEDLGQPEIRKKFCRCILLMDRISNLYQYNNPKMIFSSYVNRLPNLQSTIANITQTDNIRNSSWSYATWGWNYWSGYQDSFVTVNLKQGTVAKSLQVGFTLQGINMDFRLAGFQIESIPENRKSVLR